LPSYYHKRFNISKQDVRFHPDFPKKESLEFLTDKAWSIMPAFNAKALFTGSMLAMKRTKVA
jgi:hypothetical protein